MKILLVKSIFGNVPNIKISNQVSNTEFVTIIEQYLESKSHLKSMFENVLHFKISIDFLISINNILNQFSYFDLQVFAMKYQKSTTESHSISIQF